MSVVAFRPLAPRRIRRPALSQVARSLRAVGALGSYYVVTEFGNFTIRDAQVLHDPDGSVVVDLGNGVYTKPYSITPPVAGAPAPAVAFDPEVSQAAVEAIRAAQPAVLMFASMNVNPAAYYSVTVPQGTFTVRGTQLLSDPDGSLVVDLGAGVYAKPSAASYLYAPPPASSQAAWQDTARALLGRQAEAVISYLTTVNASYNWTPWIIDARQVLDAGGAGWDDPGRGSSAGIARIIVDHASLGDPQAAPFAAALPGLIQTQTSQNASIQKEQASHGSHGFSIGMVLLMAAAAAVTYGFSSGIFAAAAETTGVAAGSIAEYAAAAEASDLALGQQWLANVAAAEAAGTIAPGAVAEMVGPDLARTVLQQAAESLSSSPAIQPPVSTPELSALDTGLGPTQTGLPPETPSLPNTPNLPSTPSGSGPGSTPPISPPADIPATPKNILDMAGKAFSVGSTLYRFIAGRNAANQPVMQARPAGYLANGQPVYQDGAGNLTYAGAWQGGLQSGGLFDNIPLFVLVAGALLVAYVAAK